MARQKIKQENAKDGQHPVVYILASSRNGTLYVGVSSNLIARLLQHRNHEVAGFTSKYNVIKLVYYEFYASMPEAIIREKRLKKWNRNWKIKLIEKDNPDWIDLWDKIRS